MADHTVHAARVSRVIMVTMCENKPSIAIVGAGPRGISILERIAAYAPTEPLSIYLIDDAQLGAGRIWETTQTPLLCMNTLAGAVTLFTEPGATVNAPVVEGPIQYEWIRLILGKDRDTMSSAKVELFDRFRPDTDALIAEFGPELEATRPESNPSRALYGAYLRWVYAVAQGLLPENVELIEAPHRAVGITEVDDHDVITLSDGSSLHADATVLATGWVRPGDTPEEQQLAALTQAHPEFTWVRPNNPVEQDFSTLQPGQDVIVRGLGMGFFDALTLLTQGRGGTFEEADTRSGLVYHPSGKEPHIYVTSGRGYPYLPKSEYKSLPPTADLTRLHKVITELSDRTGLASIDFGTEVLPAVIRDAHEAYYRTLDQVFPGVINLDEIVRTIDEGAAYSIQDRLKDIVPAEHFFDLTSWLDKLDGVEGSATEVTERIAAGLAADITEAVAAWDSPLKAGLWSISASRKPVSILGARGVYTAESRRGPLKRMMGLGQMVGSGPPLFRTRELLALVDAGLVTLLGGRPTVTADESGFHVSTAQVKDTVDATALIDAWMHSPTTARPADPLSVSIEDAGRARTFNNVTSDGALAPSGSPEINPHTRALVRADGTEDPRVHLVGIPTGTGGQMPDVTISPMPGTDPLMLQETDQVAASLLRVATR